MFSVIISAKRGAKIVAFPMKIYLKKGCYKYDQCDNSC